MSWVYNYYYGPTEDAQKNPELIEETKNENAVQEGYLSNDSDLVIPEEDNFLENDDVSIDQ